MTDQNQTRDPNYPANPTTTAAAANAAPSQGYETPTAYPTTTSGQYPATTRAQDARFSNPVTDQNPTQEEFATGRKQYATSTVASSATQDELNAAADRAEAASNDAAAKAAANGAPQSDKDAAAKAASDATAARAAADEGPTHGTVTVSLTGSFAPFKDSTKEFLHTADKSLSGAISGAIAFLNRLETDIKAELQQNANDQREVADAEARDARIANIKAGRPANEYDPNAGRDTTTT